MGVIYAIVSNETGEVLYVGQSKNLAARIKAHRSHSFPGGKKSRLPLYAWLIKHGFDAIHFETLAHVDNCLLDVTEIEWIAHFKALGLARLNVSLGGQSPIGEGTRERMSQAQRGKITTDETRRRMSESQRRRYQNPEERAKTAAASSGKPLSQEHRDKLSSALKGKPFTDDHRQKISDGLRRHHGSS